MGYDIRIEKKTLRLVTTVFESSSRVVRGILVLILSAKRFPLNWSIVIWFDCSFL